MCERWQAPIALVLCCSFTATEDIPYPVENAARLFNIRYRDETTNGTKGETLPNSHLWRTRQDCRFSHSEPLRLESENPKP